MASAVGTPGYIIERCKALKGNWSTRDKKFSDWYNILLQEDKLAQEGMESVVTNDPRTGYNLAKHLLISMIIADKVPSEELTPEQIPGISYLESFISKRWDNQERRYRKIGRQSWIGEAVSWLLATGWYSVFSMVTKDEIWAEVWSPADCYPDFGTDGLVEHAHIYTLSPGAANRKVKLMGWTVSRPFTNKVDVYDHWTFDATGSVVNAVVMGDEFVKTPVVDSAMSKLGILPIFTSPAGGLPDRGSIKSSGWQEHYGECLVATNEGLNDNYNRMRTFYQQSARYGAQHHWLETSQGETPIATDEIMSRWGSVLHGQPGEDVRAIQPAAMPVELTNIMYTYQNELQRGLFPSAVFGNVQQQMSYLAMANVASASLQVLTPYIEAFKGLRTDIDNFWTRMLLEVGLRPYNFKKPTGIPEETEFDVSADVEIPGYLIQRATVSRMLNPQFRLPNEYVMERMFPDIKNSLKAQADTRKEDAMAHPKAILVDQILAYREQARMLRELEPPDTEGADLYEKLAKSLESELDPQTQQPVGPGQQAPVTPAQEVMPQELMAPIEGMGRMA